MSNILVTESTGFYAAVSYLTYDKCLNLSHLVLGFSGFFGILGYSLYGGEFLQITYSFLETLVRIEVSTRYSPCQPFCKVSESRKDC